MFIKHLCILAAVPICLIRVELYGCSSYCEKLLHIIIALQIRLQKENAFGLESITVSIFEHLE